MPQNDYIEEAQRRFGKRLNHDEKLRKKAARKVKKDSKVNKKNLVFNPSTCIRSYNPNIFP